MSGSVRKDLVCVISFPGDAAEAASILGWGDLQAGVGVTESVLQVLKPES